MKFLLRHWGKGIGEKRNISYHLYDWAINEDANSQRGILKKQKLYLKKQDIRLMIMEYISLQQWILILDLMI